MPASALREKGPRDLALPGGAPLPPRRGGPAGAPAPRGAPCRGLRSLRSARRQAQALLGLPGPRPAIRDPLEVVPVATDTPARPSACRTRRGLLPRDPDRRRPVPQRRDGHLLHQRMGQDPPIIGQPRSSRALDVAVERVLFGTDSNVFPPVAQGTLRELACDPENSASRGRAPRSSARRRCSSGRAAAGRSERVKVAASLLATALAHGSNAAHCVGESSGRVTDPRTAPGSGSDAAPPTCTAGAALSSRRVRGEPPLDAGRDWSRSTISSSGDHPAAAARDRPPRRSVFLQGGTACDRAPLRLRQRIRPPCSNRRAALEDRPPGASPSNARSHVGVDSTTRIGADGAIDMPCRARTPWLLS